MLQHVSKDLPPPAGVPVVLLAVRRLTESRFHVLMPGFPAARGKDQAALEKLCLGLGHLRHRQTQPWQVLDEIQV